MRDVLSNLISNLVGDLDNNEIEDLLHSISTIISQFKVRSYPMGTVLCHEKQNEDIFYVLTRGEVNVEKTFQDGNKRLLTTLGPGQFFGEMSLILDQPRSADVITTTDVVVMELARKEFERATRLSPRITELISDQAMSRSDDNWHKENDEKTQNISVAPLQVFTSYSSKDREFVAKFVDDLQERLTDNNVKVWLDKNDIPSGAEWDVEIENALNESEIMLLMISPSSISSKNVTDEWSYHMSHDKAIIPVMIEDCNLPFRIHRLQYIDITELDYHIGLARVFKEMLDKVQPDVAGTS